MLPLCVGSVVSSVQFIESSDLNLALDVTAFLVPSLCISLVLLGLFDLSPSISF